MAPKQSHDIHYYMSIPYKTEIEPLSEENGGGFEACHPTLGRSTCVAVGETPEEALLNLKKEKEILFELWLDKGLQIPLPENESRHDNEYSGKVLVRMTPDMHRQLTSKAKEQNVSLNAYINQSITLGFSLQQFEENLKINGFLDTIAHSPKSNINQKKYFEVRPKEQGSYSNITKFPITNTKTLKKAMAL